MWCLSVGNILYIESMGNLLKIHYLSGGTNVATRVIRNTLKNLAALEHFGPVPLSPVVCLEPSQNKSGKRQFKRLYGGKHTR